MVYNNYFHTGERFAINLMNHGADPLENIIIVHNTFIDSGPILLGGKGDHRPEKVVLANNLFLDPTDLFLSDPSGNESFAGNVIDQSMKNLPDGFTRVRLKYDENKFGILQPGEENELHEYYSPEFPALLDIPTMDDDPLVALDILKQNRLNNEEQFVGCSVPGMKAEMKPYATVENTGPDYLHK